MKNWTVGYGGGSEVKYREGTKLLRIGAERGPGDAVVLYVRDLTQWTEPAGEALSREARDEVVRRVREDLTGAFEVFVEE